MMSRDRSKPRRPECFQSAPRAVPLMWLPVVFSLVVTVQAANPLLQQIRVEGQIEQDQVMGKLEVAALAAYLRAHQGLGSVNFVGEIGGSAISLDN